MRITSGIHVEMEVDIAAPPLLKLLHRLPRSKRPVNRDEFIGCESDGRHYLIAFAFPHIASWVATPSPGITDKARAIQLYCQLRVQQRDGTLPEQRKASQTLALDPTFDLDQAIARLKRDCEAAQAACTNEEQRVIQEAKLERRPDRQRALCRTLALINHRYREYVASMETVVQAQSTLNRR